MRGVRVLFAHGVVERKTDPLLERNFHRLASFREVVGALRRLRTDTLDDLAEHLTSARRRPLMAALLTFDDGYANNFRAGEILSAARIPFVVFVSTEAVGTTRTIWTPELSLPPPPGAGIRRVDLLGRRWPLRGRRSRVATFEQVRRRFKALPAAARSTALPALRAQFPAGGTARLLEAFPAFRMLSWEGLRQIEADGARVGSHGADHEIHHAAQPEAVRRTELTRSYAALTRRLGSPPLAFAFPNGDFTTSSAEEVRAAGYRLGFTIQPSVVRPEANPYLLPRLKLAASAVTFLRDFQAGRGRP